MKDPRDDPAVDAFLTVGAFALLAEVRYSYSSIAQGTGWNSEKL